LYRKRLHRFLAAAPDEKFLELIWATNSLQSDREAAAAKVLGTSYPSEAASEDMTSSHAIYPWELETLANEALTVLKGPIPKGNKSVDCQQWAAIVTAVSILRKLENQEYGVFSKPEDILREMYRIGGRQFDWQRGYFNKPLFYRSAFLYSGPKCASYLDQKSGTSVAEMSLTGFAIHTATREFPAINSNMSVLELGLDADAIGRVLQLISFPLAGLRDFAREQRAGWHITAYRPSALRRYPCVALPAGNRILCPLPELVIERVTSGLFYDLISGSGDVRNEYGKRFETYALQYIRAQLPNLGVRPEWSYKWRGQSFDTPDIVTAEDERVKLVFECKASRMSFAARFAEKATMERGYDDIVKGVFQLWRFFSHCRRGNTGVTLAADACGVLLTLDSWLVMGGPVTKEIMHRAHDLANTCAEPIPSEDRKPVIFCPVTDLETVLADSDEQSFLDAVQASTTEKYDGWMLSAVHREVGRVQPRKDYPFTDLATLLPWWGKIEQMKEERERTKGANKN
jgi:hypothetical protein